MPRTAVGDWWTLAFLAGSIVATSVSAVNSQNPVVRAPSKVPTVFSSLDDAAKEPKGMSALRDDTTAPSVESSLSPGQASGSSERAWSEPSQKPESEKSFWERIPPVTPFARLGSFFIAPSKPGFYTILNQIRARQLDDRPKNPYLQWGQSSNPFFNVDFRYIDDPNNTQTDFLDPLKRIHMGDNWLFSMGGEVRDRYATIQNAALNDKKPQAGATDSFNLFRTRLYGDLWYQDIFRLYIEFIAADSSSQSIPPSSSDIDQNDFLNLFIDVKLFSVDDYNACARVGRQELSFGSQRLVSLSDWSNTQRTFQGVRGTFHNETIEEDIFVTNLVVPSAVGTISSIDDKQVFAGNWFKYRFTTDISLDLYYLYLENDNSGVATGQYGAKGGYDVDTFGSRFVGQDNQFLWDFEGALQFGSWSNQQIFAGMYSTGIGYWFKNLPGTPTFWTYYDYGSGDQNPGGSNVHHTFNELFEFGHANFAGLDAIGRENIRDFHLELGTFPADWLRFTVGYHVLNLDSAKDALYNQTGSVVRQDPTGKAGTDVGQALAATVQFHISNHQMILINYAHLYAGEFIKDTAVNAGAAKDLDAWWFQYVYKW